MLSSATIMTNMSTDLLRKSHSMVTCLPLVAFAVIHCFFSRKVVLNEKKTCGQPRARNARMEFLRLPSAANACFCIFTISMIYEKSSNAAQNFGYQQAYFWHDLLIYIFQLSTLRLVANTHTLEAERAICVLKRCRLRSPKSVQHLIYFFDNSWHVRSHKKREIHGGSHFFALIWIDIIMATHIRETFYVTKLLNTLQYLQHQMLTWCNVM